MSIAHGVSHGSAVSALFKHYLPMYYKKDARLIWVDVHDGGPGPRVNASSDSYLDNCITFNVCFFVQQMWSSQSAQLLPLSVLTYSSAATSYSLAAISFGVDL